MTRYARARYWLAFHYPNRPWVLRFNRTPTQADVDAKAIVGPFRTKRAATYMATHPYCPDVATAERESKQEARRAVKES